MSCRASARRFGVAAATVIRWHDQRCSTGGYGAKAHGGDTRSRQIEAHAHTILALHADRSDITLDELRRDAELAARGLPTMCIDPRRLCAPAKTMPVKTDRNDARAIAQVTDEIVALAKQYGRYGYRRVTALLHAAGWLVRALRA